MARKLGIGVLLVLLMGTLIIFLLRATSPIDPATFAVTEPRPLTGTLAPNNRLDDADIIKLTLGAGPEDVAVGRGGALYGGLEDGKIIRLEPGGSETVFADTGGRPLGLAFDQDGQLLVADSALGLLSVSPEGAIVPLVSSVAGERIGFADDVDVAPDGTVYFSDASSKYGLGDLLYDALEGRPWGRLIAYEPKSGQSRIVLDGLYFANGVAVSPDGQFVLVNETWTHRVRRLWLTGAKAGQDEIFIDALPGYPDGIAAASDGTFWMTLYTLRSADADGLAAHPFWRGVLAHFPSLLGGTEVKHGFVIHLSADGEILASYQDADGSHVPFVTSAEPHDGTIYLGSLITDQIVKLEP